MFSILTTIASSVLNSEILGSLGSMPGGWLAGADCDKFKDLKGKYCKECHGRVGKIEGKKYWVGFDLGGTKMLGVVYDSNFKPLSRCRKKTKGNEGAEAGLERIGATIQNALDQAGVSAEQLAGIGIGCPGPLDLNKGVIHEAPNLGWENVPVKATLGKRFGCPVVVSNDVDAGVYGEYQFGAGKRKRCVVGIFPGTGIGGGGVINGDLIQGNNCTCMEIGHIVVASDGPADGFGNVGTLESLASRLAISSAAAQAAFRGQAPYLLRECGTDLSSIRSGQLAAAIKNGDTVVKQIVETACRHLATGVVTIIHLLAPDVIVLGGGLVEAMPELFVNSVSKTVRKRVIPAYLGHFEIVAAKLGDDASVQGAAAWAKRKIESES